MGPNTASVPCGSSRWKTLLRTAILLAAFPRQSFAAYVEVKDCYDTIPQASSTSSFPRLKIETLRASLDINSNVAQLELDLTGYYANISSCNGQDQVLRNISSTLDISSVTRFQSYKGETSKSSCREYNYQNYHHALFHQQSTYKVTRPFFLDTFDLSLHLTDASNVSFACAHAHITPSLNDAISTAALWAPISTFLLILLLALWHEAFPLPSRHQQVGPFIADPSPSHLTTISQSLSYIQFIFFSASLSIQYPGFLRAVASKSSWSTLMIPRGPILSATPYYGVRDGIYEVNGTFGGTAGLELMTQVLGAPITMSTWVNIISLCFILLLSKVILFQLSHRLPYARTRWFTGDAARRMRGTTDAGVRGTAWTVLRLFLSYFLTPVTAWATYQLTGATFLPIYHTVLTAFVITLLIAAFWWGVTQNSPRNMGYLLLDSSKRLQTPGRLSKSQDRYAMATFALMFVRGAAVGGLQIAGFVQLLVLVACEIVQLLVMGFTWQAFPLIRVGGLLAGAQLVVLGLCVGFLPGVAEHEAKSRLGLVILGVHIAVLLGAFVLPSLVRLGALLAHSICSIRERSNEAQEEGLGEYRLRHLNAPAPQNTIPRPISVQTFENPRSPSSLLMSPISTAPLRRDPPQEDVRSLAGVRRHRVSLLSSSSEGSAEDPNEPGRILEDFDDNERAGELESPGREYEARVGRRFSSASMLNYSRPLHGQPQSP
nr:uncharacterized protein CTRU02_11109 [Colletotrichum truncatum]KAF6786238.1 integral membrane protein [Colletotrichum truncatum]